ncbi:MAG: recombinase family protein [Fluviicola sp.]
MKTAVLYIRVSTDEQADRGYSLGVQQEQLEKYCEVQGIEILKLFREDHSAKDFERPEFKKFMEYAKSNYRNIDQFLFVSWDRFSRNAPDAYTIIGKLRKWNIEPQAITQPIDFNVPQSKIMLSIYLTLPEVDNDVRSEKITSGIRGANKLGRWTSKAPIGYLNRRDEQNKPIIVKAENAHHIEWAFKEAAKAVRPWDDIRRELNSKGVCIQKSTFCRMLRNPAYMGKIYIKATETEEAYLADGIHEPIVSETLFYQVQKAMDGRIKKLNKHRVFTDKEELPLRGLLACSNCGHHITGSASRSRNGKRHFYYHCNKCKQERFKADSANESIEGLLEAMEVNEEVQNLYMRILESEQNGNPKQQAQKKSTLVQKLNKMRERKENLQNAFLDGDIEAKDYSELKKKIEYAIEDLKAEIAKLKETKSSFQQQLKQTIQVLPNMLEWYRNSSVQQKKELLGSIFPEKLVFDGKQVRTTIINPVLALVLRYAAEFRENKKGQNEFYSYLSHLVVPPGLEPGTT